MSHDAACMEASDAPRHPPATMALGGAIAPMVMGQLVQGAPGVTHGFDLGFVVFNAVMLAGCVVGIFGQDQERSKLRSAAR